MYALHFDYKTSTGYRGLILHYLPIKNRTGKSDYKWILGIAADFECKDELKEFCKQRGGNWDFVNKFWYFPLEIPNKIDNWKQETFTAIWNACKSVINEFSEYIRIAGKHNLAIEAKISEESESWIQEQLKEQVALDNRANIKLVQGEAPTLFNIKWVSDVDDENAHEYRGDEGHFEGDAHLPNGTIQRVEVCGEEQPKDFESQNNDPIMGEHVGYRHFLASDGKRYWCRPLVWVDFAIWGDAKLTSTEEANKPVEKAKDIITTAPKLTRTETIENPDCKIAVAVSKDREPLFFTIEFDKNLGNLFNWLVQAARRIDGRSWNGSKKRWEVPIESYQELKKELIECYGDSNKSSTATFSLSNKARELLYPEGVPSFIRENVK